MSVCVSVQDQFLRAAPVSGGVGEFLMRKMGWRTGEGLGRNREGTVEPIIIDFKVDRKGAKGHRTLERQPSDTEFDRELCMALQGEDRKGKLVSCEGMDTGILAGIAHPDLPQCLLGKGKGRAEESILSVDNGNDLLTSLSSFEMQSFHQLK